MTRKRKRPIPTSADIAPCKRHRKGIDEAANACVTHPTLSLYYPQINTLRDHILSKLPTTSKTRRRKIAAFGLCDEDRNGCPELDGSYGVDGGLAKLLDRALICKRPDGLSIALEARQQDFLAFSQRNEGVDESSLLEGSTPQSEIADDEQIALPGIPGLVLHYPNSHVGTLKSRLWSDLLNLLGKDGEQIMLETILECAIYAPVESGKGNYYQLSGVPMTDLQPMAAIKPSDAIRSSDVGQVQSDHGRSKAATIYRSPSAISFVRNRMFYARAALNAKGKVRFGLRHIHVLNRYPNPEDKCHTLQVLMYIFPRQFGLHNVFTSPVDASQTAQPLPDYTLRESEIAKRNSRASCNIPRARDHSPKRLRGNVFELVKKMQKLHSHCAYYELLKHYCPLKAKKPGNGDSQVPKLLQKPPPPSPPQIPKSDKISSSDMKKRKELLLEFLYYLFDSILIPLIRSNFHVTESNQHKNRIFYFRHDVWRALTEPALTRIKHTMFEEIPFMKARQLLDARSLGFSQIRLLPKGTSLRPITNLRRRVTKLQGGKAVLGRSINSIVAPVHKMLDLERQLKPESVGSALFSVGDMYPKLKAFRDKILSKVGGMPPLYFAKVDVKSCFDTIPQGGAVRIMEQLVSEDVYRVARHAQIKVSDTRKYGHGTFAQAKPTRKFVASAHPPLDFRSFDEMVEETFASERKNTVFIDNVLRTAHKKQRLLELLREHVEQNIVRIGKKFFRQKNGIPQGSVLSSLLCNCFYAKLEADHLSAITAKDSLLLRLIDDFLFITRRKEEAVEFLQTMHDGIKEYGVMVNPAKSLANFDVNVNGVSISTTADASFPYCGVMINTRTLEISKDRNRRKATGTRPITMW
ncbi:MAG: hypothetical protein Q9188_004680 [Gyalolechia gomerana]